MVMRSALDSTSAWDSKSGARGDERELWGRSNSWLCWRANARAGWLTGPIVRRSYEGGFFFRIANGRNPGRGDDPGRAEGAIARRI